MNTTQEMDVFYFGNPLNHLLQAVPDADMAISTETCGCGCKV